MTVLHLPKQAGIVRTYSLLADRDDLVFGNKLNKKQNRKRNIVFPLSKEPTQVLYKAKRVKKRKKYILKKVKLKWGILYLYKLVNYLHKLLYLHKLSGYGLPTVPLIT